VDARDPPSAHGRDVAIAPVGVGRSEGVQRYDGDFVSTDRRSLSSRAPLPEGTLPVGFALLIAGFSTLAFFRVGQWAVGGDEEDFKPILALWFATFALAPGFFLPLEQELSRALSARRALDEGGQPVFHRVRSLGAILAGLVALVIIFASPFITSSYFDGNWVMLVALLAAFVGYAPAHLARGICSGSGRFDDYAIVMGSDGVVRIVLCVALALIGIEAVGAYGFAVAVAPVLSVLVVWRRGALRTEPGPPATWQEVTPNLGWLLIGTVCAAILLNAGPVTANILAEPNQDAEVTAFAQGVLIARVPLFLFQAVQAALLPRLSRLAARGEYDEFRSGFKKLMVIVVAVGVLGTAGAFVVGPAVVDIMYGADLSGRTLAMLALGSALYMQAIATSQAVIALHGHSLVALGWAVSVVTFVLGTWLAPDELFARIEIGLVISSATALAIFAIALRYKMASGEVPDPESVMEAITEIPLES
jgi:O-antigen/teichoic acid export membrane protein